MIISSWSVGRGLIADFSIDSACGILENKTAPFILTRSHPSSGHSLYHSPSFDQSFHTDDCGDRDWSNSGFVPLSWQSFLSLPVRCSSLSELIVWLKQHRQLGLIWWDIIGAYSREGLPDWIRDSDLNLKLVAKQPWREHSRRSWKCKDCLWLSTFQLRRDHF